MKKDLIILMLIFSNTACCVEIYYEKRRLELEQKMERMRLIEQVKKYQNRYYDKRNREKQQEIKKMPI